jgi:hypothetical protein
MSSPGGTREGHEAEPLTPMVAGLCQLRWLFLVAAASSWPAGESRAQSASDSTAVVRALGAALRKDVRAVVSTFACFDGVHPCPTPGSDSTHPLIAEFARAAGARVVRERSTATTPPCPWGDGASRPNVGYIVGIARLEWSQRGDTAHVLVLANCDNPPGYLHDIFGRDDQYDLVRYRHGEWKVAKQHVTRITRREAATSSPGAQGA